MNIRPLSKDLQEKAIKELNEDPSRIAEDIKHIKDWLSKQPHIKARMDDQFILSFLRGCKFSMEKTKKKLDNYYTLKTITSEFYANRNIFDPEIQRHLAPGSIRPTEPFYILSRNSIAVENKLSVPTLFKLSCMFHDIFAMEDDVGSITGISILEDMKDTTMGFALTVPPSAMKKFAVCAQLGFAPRIRTIYFYNTPSFFQKIYDIFSPFIPAKMKNKIRVLPTFEDLCKYVPLEVFPEEYGGKGGKVDEIAVYWRNKIESYHDWFLDDMQYRTDESKRPGEAKTIESVFGVDGSFRQLSVD